MRARVAILFALGTLGLGVGTGALADSPSLNPPTQISPADGTTFTAPADGIVFQASVPLVAAPSHLDFFISRGTAPDPTTGVLSPHIDDIQSGPPSDPSSDPVTYAATPTADVNWPSRPGTYYWQASYHDCSQTAPDPTDCENQSLGPPLSFIINPRPASSVTVANPPDTFLTDHPRRRIHKRRARFAFSSDVAGAHFQCLYAQGWAACKSPHTFRHLKPGRFRFQARAVVSGVEDPTPASWVFKVLR